MKKKECKLKDPWLSVGYSTIFSGLGLLYSGRILIGLIYIIVQIVLITFFISLYLLKEQKGGKNLLYILILSFIIYLLSLISSWFSAKKKNTKETQKIIKKEKNPWLAYLLNQFFPGIGCWYLKHFWTGFWHFILFSADLTILVILIYKEPFEPKFSVVAAIFFVILKFFTGIEAINKTKVTRKKSRYHAILLTILFAIFNFFQICIPTYFLKPIKIQSSEMYPTITQEDTVLTFFIQLTPKKNDLVVFKNPLNQQPTLQRVIATTGDQLKIQNNTLLLNEIRIKENYTSGCTFSNQQNLIDLNGKVPNEAIVVLGDNREEAKDSRHFGYLKINKVLGRALIVIKEESGQIIFL